MGSYMNNKTSYKLPKTMKELPNKTDPLLFSSYPSLIGSVCLCDQSEPTLSFSFKTIIRCIIESYSHKAEKTAAKDHQAVVSHRTNF